MERLRPLCKEQIATRVNFASEEVFVVVGSAVMVQDLL